MNRVNRRQLIQGAAGALASGTMPTSAAELHGKVSSGGPLISASSRTVVETDAGKVRGYISRGVWVFRGIPYAEPSGGANRFLPPVKAKPWAGIRSCLTYGPACPSGIGVSEGGDNSPHGDEDNFLLYRTGGWLRGENCLRLNVWTPGPTTPGRKRSVMVFMHGGGYTGGSGNDLLSYDGENLARHHDVVVVTHNHRLNVFGFLNLAEIAGERFANSGNVGMLDNVAVLEWVRDNIANFGGDPGNVMIYGQSGGGGKVSHLMVMPAAQGLFHRAAVQSGATLRTGSPEAAAKIAAALLDELNVSRSQFEKLQTIPAATLVASQASAVRRVTGGRGRGLNGWGPILDGKVIPAHPFDPSAPAISRNVPLMIGTCLNEFVNGVDNPEVATLTNEELLKRVTDRYGEAAQDIIAAYRREYPKESPFGVWAAISAAEVRKSAATQAERKAARAGAPAYQYIYAWRTPVLDDRPGTFHSSEIAFVFDNGDLCTRYSGGGPEGLRLSSTISEAWTSFARTGKPGHRGLPDWPAYTVEKRATMIFNNLCAVRSDPEGECLRLITQAEPPRPA